MAYVSEDELGYVEGGGRCGAFYGVKTNPDLKDDPDFVPVYTATQLAAERVQAINDALNCYSPDDTATDWSDKIRALAGGSK